MLIVFTVKGQKVSHDLGRRMLVAESIGVVQCAFTFDTSWDNLDRVIVFTNTNKKCLKPQPVRYDGDIINIPVECLKAGKLYVSIVGYGENNYRKTTRHWDIQQAITVQECGALGGCDLLRSFGSSDVPENAVATDPEVRAMLNEVFGPEEPEPPSEPIVDENDIATDPEVRAMLNEVFGT